jgi:hypothetical protein
MVLSISKAINNRAAKDPHCLATRTGKKNEPFSNVIHPQCYLSHASDDAESLHSTAFTGLDDALVFNRFIET